MALLLQANRQHRGRKLASHLLLLWLGVPDIPSTGHAGQVDGFIAAHAGKRSLQELDDPRLDQQVSWWTPVFQSAKAAM